MKPYSAKQRHDKISKIDFMKHQKNLKDIDFYDDYLNINAVNLDLTENIFRIFKYEYFIKDLIDKKLTLVRPHTWQDPFENFLLNSQGQLDDGRIVNFDNIRDSFYSQCWSLREECDGIWRNYKGENEFAIKAKTTSKKLFNAIYDINNKFHCLCYFIGKVDYVSDNEIADFFKDKIDFNNFQSGLELASTLLMKRKSFSYEEEVRIIVYDKTPNPTDFLYINLNLNDIVDEIIFDPWIKPNLFNEKKQELMDKGFTGQISKSGLYSKPFFIAKL